MSLKERRGRGISRGPLDGWISRGPLNGWISRGPLDGGFSRGPLDGGMRINGAPPAESNSFQTQFIKIYIFYLEITVLILPPRYLQTV